MIGVGEALKPATDVGQHLVDVRRRGGDVAVRFKVKASDHADAQLRVTGFLQPDPDDERARLRR
ncbi:MAG TPA: hypothetical protein VN714_04520 [Trebonia sp.]|nr:hypothetical protein [Trebonia sp.]